MTPPTENQYLSAVTRADREYRNGHKGRVIWFTGLSGAGKSTLANALARALFEEGYQAYVLDGDTLRQGLTKDLGFTDTDRIENIRRAAEVAKILMDAGHIVLTALISPFRQERALARALIGDKYFHEVYVSTSLEVCEQRDVKGLYRRARMGELKAITGIDSPYEPPVRADLVIDTADNSIEESIDELMGFFGEIEGSRANF